MRDHERESATLDVTLKRYNAIISYALTNSTTGLEIVRCIICKARFILIFHFFRIIHSSWMSTGTLKFVILV